MLISEILKNKKIEKVSNRTNWQLEAIDFSKKLSDGKENIAGIMRCFKNNYQVSKLAMLDSLELGKPFSKYFFKVYWGILKNQRLDKRF